MEADADVGYDDPTMVSYTPADTTGAVDVVVTGEQILLKGTGLDSTSSLCQFEMATSSLSGTGGILGVVNVHEATEGSGTYQCGVLFNFNSDNALGDTLTGVFQDNLGFDGDASGMNVDVTFTIVAEPPAPTPTTEESSGGGGFVVILVVVVVLAAAGGAAFYFLM